MKAAEQAQPGKTVLITGATGGIGSALAELYAAPGTTLILQGRNAARLGEVAAACAARGARVTSRELDVRNRAELTAWLAEVSRRETVELALATAGLNTNIGPGRAG